MKGCRVSLNKTKPIHSSSCAIGNSFHYYKKTLLRLKKKKERKKEKEKKRKKKKEDIYTLTYLSLLATS